MNFAEIKKLVIAEYDTRNLVSNVRYKALDDFDDFLKSSDFVKLWNDVSKFPKEKEKMKYVYCRYQGKDKLNQAESSMINEVYTQIKGQGIQLSDYSKKD